MKGARSLFTLAIASGAAISPACSVCIAHAMGSAIHAIGGQTLKKGSTVIGVSFSSFSKDQAGEMPGTTESHRQTELDIQLLHGIDDRCMVRLNVPYVMKSLAMTGEDTIRTQGLGDLSLGATYQFRPSTEGTILWAAEADLKLPTGANRLRDSNGDRLEEHSQVGTGSTDLSLGLTATSKLSSNGIGFAGLRYRSNGRNGSGYRYGNAWFYNVGYALTLDENSSLVLELNGRIAQKDRTEEGEYDENSGGHLGYASISYRRNLGRDFGLVGTYQLPAFRNLNGSQSESGLLTIGIFRKI